MKLRNPRTFSQKIAKMLQIFKSSMVTELMIGPLRNGKAKGTDTHLPPSNTNKNLSRQNRLKLVPNGILLNHVRDLVQLSNEICQENALDGLRIYVRLSSFFSLVTENNNTHRIAPCSAKTQGKCRNLFTSSGQFCCGGIELH